MTDDPAARAAAQQLTTFITEIDTEFKTWRAFDLGRRWGSPDSLPLYPTDASLPTTTVGTVRAILLGYKQLAEENRQLRAEAARRRIMLERIAGRFWRFVGAPRDAYREIVDFIHHLPGELRGRGDQDRPGPPCCPDCDHMVASHYTGTDVKTGCAYPGCQCQRSMLGLEGG